MIVPKMGNRLITFIKIQTTKFRTHIETKQQNSEHILKPALHMKYQVIQKNIEEYVHKVKFQENNNTCKDEIGVMLIPRNWKNIGQ